MTIHYRTQGFIFKKIDFGETDRFYFLFTKNFGRLEVLAKGVRKIQAKLKSSLELFNFAEIEFVQGKNYKTLTDALVIDSFSDLKKDLRKLKIAFEISFLLDKLLKGEEKDEKIWDLLKETFVRLNSCSLFIVHCSLIYYCFLWNFLCFLGYRPEIQKCLLCQNKIREPRNYFSGQEGGIICFSCSKKIKEKTRIDLNTIKLLKLILQKDWQFLKRVKITPSDFKNLVTISQNYLTFIENQL